MAYVQFGEGAFPITASFPSTTITPPVSRPRFSALEWSVVMLAARDTLSSLRVPGRVAMAMGRIFGSRTNPRLADPQLEALRKMAVLTWHYGYTVPSVAVQRFVTAGFSLDQYELLVDSIGTARAKRMLKAA